MPTTASEEKERESIASLFTDGDCEGLKADLNLFQQFHAQNPKDVQAPEVYKSVPLRLECARDSLLELCPKARNSEVSRVSYVHNFYKGLCNSFKAGRTSYALPTLFCSYFLSSDEEFSDSSDMSDQSCNMRQDMIQDAVKMLLKAMSILTDDNGEVVDKLANQIYFSPCTGNTQGAEYRGGLLASGKDAKDALVQDSRYAPELKEQALALIFLRETQTRKVDTNITETQLQDAITILEEVLMIHPNDCEATLSLGKGHYYLWLDSTLHLDSDVRESYRQKAIKYFSDVRDKPATAVMLKKVENLLDTLCERHTEDNLNRATDENVMLMKFVRVLFEAMSLGTYKRCRDAGEKSVKDHLLVQELDSLRRHVDTIMMKLSESP